MKSVFCMVTHAVRRSAPIYADGFARFFAAVAFGAATLRAPPFAAAVFAAVFGVVFLLAVFAGRADVAAFVDAGAAPGALARPAFKAAALAMIASSISPASPPLAGRCDCHTSGLSAARMSSKSPLLLTLRGANSAMSRSPAQSSLCLISSQLRSPPPLPRDPQ